MIVLEHQGLTIQLRSPSFPVEVLQLPCDFKRLMNGKLQVRKGRKCNIFERHQSGMLSDDTYIDVRNFIHQANGNPVKLTRYNGTTDYVRILDDPTPITVQDRIRRIFEIRLWVDTDAGAPV